MVWIVSILILVFETDLGTSLLFFGMFVIMLYVATERTSWIVFGLLMSAAGAVGVASFEPHIQQRVRRLARPDAGVRALPSSARRPLRAGHAGPVGLRLRRHSSAPAGARATPS